MEAVSGSDSAAAAAAASSGGPETAANGAISAANAVANSVGDERAVMRAKCVAAFRSGLSYRQVAEQLDVTVGTVQSHIKQARKLGELGGEAARSKGRPRLINDAIDASLVRIMREKNTKNAKLIHEELAKAPHSTKLSYEVVRRRVKQLIKSVEELPSSLQDGSNQQTGLPASGAGRGDSDADASGYDQVARDLDMLAETVRSIVNNVKATGAESEDEETPDNGFENHNGTGVDDGDETIGNQHDSAGNADGPLTAELHSSDRSGYPEASEDASNNHQEAASIISQAHGINTTPASLPIASAIPLGAQSATALGSSSTASAKPSIPVSTRKPKKAEYTPETRAECVRKHEVDGMSYASISREMNIPQDSVRAIIRKAKRTGTVQSAPRSGRPRKTSEIVDRVILQAVRANERSSAKSIQENLLKVFNVKVSSETIRRRVLANTRQRLLAISSGQESEEPPNPETLVPVSDGNSTRTSGAASNSAIQTACEWSTEVDQRIDEFSAGSTQPTVPGSLPSAAAADSESTAWASGSKRTNEEMASIPVLPDLLLQDGASIPPPTTLIPPENDSSQPKSKRPKRREYSLELREKCVAMHQRGEGYRRIGQALDMPHTTVRAIVEKVARTGSVLPAPRSGRPRKTDSIVDRVILEAVRNNEKCSARMIQEELLHAYGVRISCETIRRRVKDHSRQNLVHGSTEQSEYAQDAAQPSENMISDSVPPVNPTPGDSLQSQSISAEQMLQLLPLPGVSEGPTTVVL